MFAIEMNAYHPFFHPSLIKLYTENNCPNLNNSDPKPKKRVFHSKLLILTHIYIIFLIHSCKRKTAFS